MTEQEMIRRVGPCGLHCGGCVAFKDGEIHRHAKALAELLGDTFSVHARRLASMHSVFAAYEGFRPFLDYLAAGECEGCRGNGCIFADCSVHACVREKGVDFCAQCDAFPCDENRMPAALKERWKKNNERLQRDGLRAFYDLIKKTPRYP